MRGREPSIQAVDAGVKRRDIGAYLLAELGQVRTDGFKLVRPPGRVVENGRSPPLVLRGGLRERQDHNLFRRNFQRVIDASYCITGT